MTNDFVRHTTITHELNGDGGMLEHRLMTAFDDVSDECTVAIFCDLVFALVANTTTRFDMFKDFFSVNGSHDFVIRLYDFHRGIPF